MEGTPHLQGYVEFKKTIRLNAVKKIISNRAHVEQARGTPTQNKTYCSKDGDFCEYGNTGNQSQGRRTDLDDIKDAIDEGANDMQIAESFFGQWVRYRSSFQAYRALKQRPSVTPSFEISTFPQTWSSLTLDWTKTLIFWGDSGIGKTEFACALLPGALMVSHMDDLKHFDPEYHSGIIFDDVDIKHFPRTAQIHLTDQTQDRSIHIRYACAMIPKNTKKIFTTNEFNGHCCDLTDKAIERRTKVYHLRILSH